MPENVLHSYERVRWVAEFSFVPLHWMMLSHLYSTATVIGSLVMVAYLFSSYRQAKAVGIIGVGR